MCLLTSHPNSVFYITFALNLDIKSAYAMSFAGEIVAFSI